jgi:hypothetical protein
MKEPNYEALYEQFVEKQLPCRFPTTEVRRHFMDRYGAISLAPSMFPELQEDIYFRADCDTHIYAIVRADAYVNHGNPHSRWRAVDEGKVSYVVFQSREGVIDCDYFSLHGNEPRLEDEIAMFNGIDPKRADLANPDFRAYLTVMQKCGLLT